MSGSFQERVEREREAVRQHAEAERSRAAARQRLADEERSEQARFEREARTFLPDFRQAIETLRNFDVAAAQAEERQLHEIEKHAHPSSTDQRAKTPLIETSGGQLRREWKMIQEARLFGGGRWRRQWTGWMSSIALESRHTFLAVESRHDHRYGHLLIQPDGRVEVFPFGGGPFALEDAIREGVFRTSGEQSDRDSPSMRWRNEITAAEFLDHTIQLIAAFVARRSPE